MNQIRLNIPGGAIDSKLEREMQVGESIIILFQTIY